MPKGIQIIAECCQNHNGSPDTLDHMVEAAAKAGAQFVKMQTIYADDVSFRPQFEEGLTVDGAVKSIKRPYKTEFDRLKGLEISEKDTRRFIKACLDNGVEPMTTCFARRWVRPLAELGFKAIKVASYDCASFPMLRELAGVYDEIIVSTGATYDDEIETAADILKGKNFAFLHCVTMYPTPVSESHLARMAYLRRFTPRVGHSDHSLVARDGLVTTLAAIQQGASIVERHFTILPRDQTRDGPVSVDAGQIAEIAAFADMDDAGRLKTLNTKYPNWREAIGSATRKLSEAELLNRDYYRGRFATPRPDTVDGTRMIFNWEATRLP